MKKIVLAIFAVTTMFGAASAQKTKEFKKRKPGYGHHHTMQMRELNLTDAQKNQLKQDNEAFRKQMEELKSNEKITVKEQRDRKEALLKERKEKFEALLTPEQKAKMAELKKQREQKHKEMAGARMEKMKTKLGLSDDQVQQLKSNNEALGAKMKAIKENDKLSRQQRKEQLSALREEQKASFKKVLTQEQLNKLEDMKKERGHKKVK